MNDEQMLRTLGSWLKGTDVAAPDSRLTADQVKVRLPQTRQRGRWWPLPSSKHPPAPADDIRGTEFQPIRIPTTTSHTPIITRRTRSMFSPAKAITAGAIVFALGGVMLIAQPFDQQGAGAPGAATDAVPAVPVEFTGRFVVGQGCSAGEVIELPGDIRRVVGAPCRPVLLETTDPRLDGEVTIVMNYDLHRPALDGSTPKVILRHQRVDIETAEGAWRSRPTLLFAADDGRPSATTSVFVGEGAYEGLTAFTEMVARDDGKGRDIRGFIVDGDIPVAPERLE